MNAPQNVLSAPTREEINRFLSDRYGKYSMLMYSIAWDYVRNSEDAEDVVSDCWLALMRRAAGLMKLEETMLLKYIAVSVKNTALNAAMRERRRRGHCANISLDEAEKFPSAFDVEEAVEARIELGLVRQAMRALPYKQRMVIVLKYINGFRDMEIARRLGLSTSSIRKYVNRARKGIKARLAIVIGAWC